MSMFDGLAVWEAWPLMSNTTGTSSMSVYPSIVYLAVYRGKVWSLVVSKISSSYDVSLVVYDREE